MSNLDDRFIKGIRSHDRAIIHEIYDRFQGRIISMIKERTGTTEDGEDVFQRALGDVLYRMIQKPDFKLTSRFYTLLHGIAKIIWQKELRKRKQVLIADQLPEGLVEEVNEVLEQREREKVLWRHIEQLGKECSKLFRLTLIDKLKDAQIAEIFNISNVGSIKVKRTRCKKRLLISLKSDPIYNDLAKQA